MSLSCLKNTFVFFPVLLFWNIRFSFISNYLFTFFLFFLQVRNSVHDEVKFIVLMVTRMFKKTFFFDIIFNKWKYDDEFRKFNLMSQMDAELVNEIIAY